MAESTYKLVFRGEISPDQQIDEVKRKLAALYKGDMERVERMFSSGKAFVMKSNLDKEAAQKLQASYQKRTGAIFEIKPPISDESTAPEFPAPRPRRAEKPSDQERTPAARPQRPQPAKEPPVQEELPPVQPEPPQPKIEKEPEVIAPAAEEIRPQAITPSAPEKEDEPLPPYVSPFEEVSTARKMIEYGIGIGLGTIILLVIYFVFMQN